MDDECSYKYFWFPLSVDNAINGFNKADGLDAEWGGIGLQAIKQIGLVCSVYSSHDK